VSGSSGVGVGSLRAFSCRELLLDLRYSRPISFHLILPPPILFSCSLALLLSCSLALLLSCSLALLLSCSLALLLSCSLALLLPLTSSRSCSFAPSQLLSASSSARPTAIRLSDPRRQHVHVHPLIPRRQGRVPPDAFDGAEEYGVYDEDDLANELDDPNVARGLQAGPSGT
jgi:hypothetical protein